jgi:hypothetical protein
MDWMASIRKRGKAGATVAGLACLLILSGCAPAARLAALQDATAEVKAFRDQIGYHGGDVSPDDFVTFVDDDGLQHGYVAIGVDEDEVLDHTGAGRLTLITDAAVDGDLGIVTAVVIGFGEAGGGGNYKNDVVYSCFTASWRLEQTPQVTLGGAECPQYLLDGPLSSYQPVGIQLLG